MRVQKIICDRCKKEIAGDPIIFYAEYVSRETGEFSTECPFEDMGEKDFCPGCASLLYQKFMGMLACQNKSDNLEKQEKKTSANKKYDHDLIWEMHNRGKRNIEIEKELGVPKTTVAWVICQRRKKEKEAEQKNTSEKQKTESEYGPEGLEGKLKELEEEVKKESLPFSKSEKKPFYNPEKMIMEKSDDGRKTIVSKRKPTPIDGQPVKVCVKNCVVCRYSSPAGYCDFSTITGESRKDKPGICTHRILRK